MFDGVRSNLSFSSFLALELPLLLLLDFPGTQLVGFFDFHNFIFLLVILFQFFFVFPFEPSSFQIFNNFIYFTTLRHVFLEKSVKISIYFNFD